MVVFKATVNGAEPIKLVTSAKGKEAGEHFKKIVAALDVLGVEGKRAFGQNHIRVHKETCYKLCSLSRWYQKYRRANATKDQANFNGKAFFKDT